MSEETYKPNSVLPLSRNGQSSICLVHYCTDQASCFSQKLRMKAALLIHSCTLHGFSRFTPEVAFGARLCSHRSPYGGRVLPGVVDPPTGGECSDFPPRQLAGQLPSFLRRRYSTNVLWICQDEKFAYNRQMTVSALLNGKTGTIGAAAGILFVSSLVSGLLGFARNGLLSWRFGAGEATDMYFAAFRIPDFLYGILIMGGISAVFLPLFSERMAQGREEAWKFASNLLNIIIGSLAVFAALVFLFAPQLIPLVAPGFSAAQIETSANLTRLMLLSPILFGISAVLSGVLHYYQRFFAYALAPVLYNLGIILGILFLAPLWGIWGVAVGVILGALLHVLIQAPVACKEGVSWQPLWNLKDASVRKAAVLAFPRTIATAAFYVNIIVMTALASLIAEGSITIFEYANHIQQLPVGLIGVSFALAAFPALSRFAVEQNSAKMRQAFSRTASNVLFFVLPLSALIFLLRAQIVRLIYGAGPHFGWDETRLTAAALGIFAFGIVFYALIPLFTRLFFALQDTKTPTFASVSAVVLNIVSAVFFIGAFAAPNTFSQFFVSALRLEGIEDIRILALPLAFVLAGIFQASLLLLLLARKTKGVGKKDFLSSAAKTAIATLASGVVTYGMLQLYGRPFPLETYARVLTQFLLAGAIGALAFVATAFLLRSSEILSLFVRFRSFLKK